MAKSIKTAFIGLGKMGLSHFAIFNAHPDVDAVICDQAGFMLDVLGKNIATPIHKDFASLIENEPLDAVVIATPSALHAPMVRAALEKGIHVFCEKPFCLDWQDSAALADLAEARGLVNQVGYHYRHVGAFCEMKRILDSGALGTVTHVQAEAYGPVILRPARKTWRSRKSEGGGCLYDYAAHPINLLNWFFGAPAHVSGSSMISVFSEDIDDQVMSALRWKDGPAAQLSVNWCDESHRKMATKISMIGTNGRLYADRQECQLYLREPVAALPEYEKGWSVKYTTELTDDTWFYLRGEEYSAQADDFVRAVRAAKDGTKPQPAVNSFRSAAETDRTMAMVIENAETGQAVGEPTTSRKPAARTKRSWLMRS